MCDFFYQMNSQAISWHTHVPFFHPDHEQAATRELVSTLPLPACSRRLPAGCLPTRTLLCKQNPSSETLASPERPELQGVQGLFSDKGWHTAHILQPQQPIISPHNALVNFSSHVS